MNLPDGWFPPDDIEAYRKLYMEVPENGITAELGVWLGRSLCSVADIILERKINVLCVDSFDGGDSPVELTEYEKAGLERLQERFMENARAFGILDSIVVMPERTDIAAANIGAAAYDLIFVDAGHEYASVKNDIHNWLPKVRSGGILAGDDFGHPGVRQAVTELLGGELNSLEQDASLWIYRKP